MGKVGTSRDDGQARSATASAQLCGALIVGDALGCVKDSCVGEKARRQQERSMKRHGLGTVHPCPPLSTPVQLEIPHLPYVATRGTRRGAGGAVCLVAPQCLRTCGGCARQAGIRRQCHHAATGLLSSHARTPRLRVRRSGRPADTALRSRCARSRRVDSDARYAHTAQPARAARRSAETSQERLLCAVSDGGSAAAMERCAPPLLPRRKLTSPAQRECDTKSAAQGARSRRHRAPGTSRRHAAHSKCSPRTHARNAPPCHCGARRALAARAPPHQTCAVRSARDRRARR
jgi:hypothetical protein